MTSRGKIRYIFSKHLGKGYKITFAFNSSVNSFSVFHKIDIVYVLRSLGSDMRCCALTDQFVFTYDLDSSKEHKNIDKYF